MWARSVYLLSLREALMAMTVRLDEELLEKLREIAEAEHRSIDQVLADAVNRYERERYWREAHAEYARMGSDPDVSREYQAEVAMLQGGAMDGLEAEEPYYTPEEEEEIRAEAARTRHG
jgi:hypothetical protein